jgi:lipopolysaccharide export system permease protein
VFDLSSFEVLKTPDSAFKTNWQMLNVKQLGKASDSIINLINISIESRIRREAMNFLVFGKSMDSGWTAKRVNISDSILSYKQLLPDSTVALTYTRATEKANLLKSSVDLINADYQQKRKDLRFHLIEWHRKFALSFACMVLFFIGAPLGSIIRKGGLGMPLVIAVVFFLIFHLLNMFGEKFVRNDVASPLLGMWLSTMILIPIGFFFTYKAMRDSQLFNQEYYFRLLRKIKNLLKK